MNIFLILRENWFMTSGGTPYNWKIVYGVRLTFQDAKSLQAALEEQHAKEMEYNCVENGMKFIIEIWEAL